MEFNKFILQDRITNVLNSNFTNENDRIFLSKSINISRATIDRWRNQSLIPRLDSIAKLSILLNKSIDNIIFEQNKLVNFSNIVFSEEEFQKRFSNIISSQFKNNLQLAKLLKVSHTTISLWKKQISIPNIIKLSLFVHLTQNSLDYIILGYE